MAKIKIGTGHGEKCNRVYNDEAETKPCAGLIDFYEECECNASQFTIGSCDKCETDRCETDKPNLWCPSCELVEEDCTESEWEEDNPTEESKLENKDVPIKKAPQVLVMFNGEISRFSTMEIAKNFARSKSDKSTVRLKSFECYIYTATKEIAPRALVEFIDPPESE